jgi:hypothetical protein
LSVKLPEKSGLQWFLTYRLPPHLNHAAEEVPRGSLGYQSRFTGQSRGPDHLVSHGGLDRGPDLIPNGKNAGSA